MFNEGNQIHNFMSSSGSGSDFLTSYGSGYGSGSTSQKVTVPTVPVPVPQHCLLIVSFLLIVINLPNYGTTRCR